MLFYNWSQRRCNAAKRRREQRYPEFVEKCYCDYSGLYHKQFTSYRNHHRAALADAERKGKCIEGSNNCVGQKRHSIPTKDNTSDEQAGDCPFSQNSDVDNVFKVFVTLLNPLSTSILYFSFSYR